QGTTNTRAGIPAARNHLYRTSEPIVNSPGNGAFFIRALGKMDHPGDVAHEFDFKCSPGGRPKYHLFDQLIH
ncbi:MAG: hypothetical protein ABW175_07050, partial [Bradyrhizobium sp.]